MSANGMRSSVMKSSTFTWIVVAFISLFVFEFIVKYIDYYELSMHQRAIHDLHAKLRSSGVLGLTMGISAAVFFVLNLAYLLRKKWIRVRWLGPLRYWMDFHIFTGMVGGAFIFIHSSLSLTSVLGALPAIALAGTIISGVVGRCIYVQVPRAYDGHELELKEVKKELEELEKLLDEAGVNFRLFDMRDLRQTVSKQSVLGTFVTVLEGGIRRHVQYKRIVKQLLELEHHTLPSKEVMVVVKLYCIHYQWIARFHDLKHLISSWRFFHRWMASLMFVVMVFHIFIAFRYFLWEKLI